MSVQASDIKARLMQEIARMDEAELNTQIATRESFSFYVGAAVGNALAAAGYAAGVVESVVNNLVDDIGTALGLAWAAVGEFVHQVGENFAAGYSSARNKWDRM